MIKSKIKRIIYCLISKQHTTEANWCSHILVQNTDDSICRVLEARHNSLQKLILTSLVELDLSHGLAHVLQFRRRHGRQALPVPDIQELRIRVVPQFPERIDGRDVLVLPQVILRHGNHHEPNEGTPGNEERVPVEEVVDGDHDRLQVDPVGDLVGGRGDDVLGGEGRERAEEVKQGKTEMGSGQVPRKGTAALEEKEVRIFRGRNGGQRERGGFRGGGSEGLGVV